MRYIGQNYEINIPLYNLNLNEKTAYEKLKETFHRKHFEIYGHEHRRKDIEIINLRLRCIGFISIQFKSKIPGMKNTKQDWLKEKRSVNFIGIDDPIQTPVFEKNLIPFGTKINGPAILEEIDSTMIIPPGDFALLNYKGDLIIRVNKR